MQYTVFECNYLHEKYRKFVKEIFFYRGNIIPSDTDWRFKEVKDKRKRLIRLGTATCNFPIEYPLILDNGFVINKNDYFKENE